MSLSFLCNSCLNLRWLRDTWRSLTVLCLVVYMCVHKKLLGENSPSGVVCAGGSHGESCCKYIWIICTIFRWF